MGRAVVVTSISVVMTPSKGFSLKGLKIPESSCRFFHTLIKAMVYIIRANARATLLMC